MQGDLDQLWYTWSKNGLDAMAMGYRVRAASGELRNTQSMRYRVIDRFLRYEPPQGININEFDARIAPISYAFISNGPEHLLIRKVFKGRDLAGRNSVFFTHLIAGLPDEFTARDAIRLWDCTDIWVESEEQKAANDTQLEPVAYTTLKRSAERAQPAPSLPFTTIRAKLEDLLLTILCQNSLAQKIYLVGRSNLAAALIYGLTHCLPLSMLGNFSFTTYESTINEIEATFVTTVTGSELADPTYLDVRSGDIPAASPIELQKYKGYVAVALNYLISGSVDTFLAFLKRMEAHNCQSSEQLLEEFNLAFGQGPLTFKQIETIITHPDEYTDKLRDPLFQQQSAMLLVEQVEYWRKQGYKTFQHAVALLNSTGSNQADPVRQAFSLYLNGVASILLPTLRDGLHQFKALEAQGQDPWKIPQHCGHLLIVLVPPAFSEQFWLRLLNEFAQPPLHTFIKSDALWPFQLWVIEQASKLPQPQRRLPQMQSWLEIPSWAKLEEVFALNLPNEWLDTAIYGRIQDVPKGALPLIQKYEPFFIAALQQLLQQGGQTNVNAVSTFFQSMVDYGYTNRISLLLALVNTYYEVGFVQTLFACVGITTPHRLQAHEINAVLANCRPEAIATCNRAQALADYLQEFILALTPAKLSSGHTPQLLNQLNQLSAGPGFPPLLPMEVADLVSHWLIIHAFISAPTLDRHQLAKTKTAITHIFRGGGQANASNLVQTFANDFIPILVKQVRTEVDLDMIQDALGTSMTGSRWDLLRWMALLAGSGKTRLYELMPYVICGLREAERTGQTANDLDTYLRSLFGQQPKEMLKNIDTAMNCDIWPDALQQNWNAWRGRGKKGLAMPSFRSNTGRLQAEQQALRLPGPDGYTPTPSSSHEQINYTLTPQGASEASSNASASPAQPLNRIIINIPSLKRYVLYEEYTKIHQVMPVLLSYWLSDRLPERKDNSKLLVSEIKTLQQINEDLYTSPTQTSRNLVVYLADDVLLEEAAKSRVTPGTVIAQSLDPERYLAAELTSFIAFLQRSISNEMLYKNGLRVLIRRYLVINQLDNQKNSLKDVLGKGGLQGFLEKEREKIQP